MLDPRPRLCRAAVGSPVLPPPAASTAGIAGSAAGTFLDNRLKSYLNTTACAVLKSRPNSLPLAKPPLLPTEKETGTQTGKGTGSLTGPELDTEMRSK